MNQKRRYKHKRNTKRKRNKWNSVSRSSRIRTALLSRRGNRWPASSSKAYRCCRSSRQAIRRWILRRRRQRKSWEQPRSDMTPRARSWRSSSTKSTKAISKSSSRASWSDSVKEAQPPWNPGLRRFSQHQSLEVEKVRMKSGQSVSLWGQTSCWQIWDRFSLKSLVLNWQFNNLQMKNQMKYRALCRCNPSFGRSWLKLRGWCNPYLANLSLVELKPLCLNLRRSRMRTSITSQSTIFASSPKWARAGTNSSRKRPWQRWARTRMIWKWASPRCSKIKMRN